MGFLLNIFDIKLINDTEQGLTLLFFAMVAIAKTVASEKQFNNLYFVWL